MQDTQNQPIWNPTRIASLSLILTPIFGSYLQASNWRALGQSERAGASKTWFYVSLFVLAAMTVVTVGFTGKAGVDKDAIRGGVNIAALVYYLIWAFASGWKQISYVQKQFGKTYAKKSLAKPILAAFACVIAYTAVVVGLLAVMRGGADDNGQDADQVSSGGSSFSLASLFGGNHGLDCAAPNVKEYVAEAYAQPLVESGIPDLVWGIRDNRIKVHVDAIHETARNNESKNIDCAANLVIDFPKDDLERATQQGDVFRALMQIHGNSLVTDPTFTTAISYQLATPSDASERKQGPIVTLTTGANRSAVNALQTYIAYYQVLAYATPDITAASKNATPWSQDFKQSVIQSCGKALGVERCTCQMNEMEKVVSEQEMARVGYTMLTSMAFSNRLTNFAKLRTAIGQQCPLSQPLTAILGEQAADVPASSVQDSAAVPASNAPQPTTVQPQQQAQPEADTSAMMQSSQPAQAAIVASFDCGKASSRIEKLVCSTPATAEVDRRLAGAYRVAAAKSSDPERLKLQQREWLKERNACDDATCLLKTTEARIQALSAM
ncbi:hypothetical protein DBB29_12380 [Pandoraea cepalis]|uniref:Lysozyme inhibitor LprI-like N-terminal domain-containing protein n=1 Tax=Pandoraea cepalis TaxID=2508294 RepID=A0AAW7MLE0_9BURK|nr:lysozyme inhibitor LprI family protein [Pandoraea cepalis]MDN4573375.1 hypothetical protein [Pandoraea cepalis]MDN4578912.1 hypothetical protein [Pandoraea cepalis]